MKYNYVSLTVVDVIVKSSFYLFNDISFWNVNT